MSTTNPICESVAERIALGEPLGDAAEHATTCARCQLVVGMPEKLGATRHEVDPGLGFSARMTIGARQQLQTRRRRRVAAVMGTSVAAALVAVLFITRSTTPGQPQPATQDPPRKQEPVAETATEAELEALVDLADVERSAHLSANWRQIKKPLSPYRKLLQGVVTP